MWRLSRYGHVSIYEIVGVRQAPRRATFVYLAPSLISISIEQFFSKLKAILRPLSPRHPDFKTMDVNMRKSV